MDDLVSSAPTPAAKVHGSLDVLRWSVIPTQARTSGNELISIIEIEFVRPNEGNFGWFNWMDHLRFQCETSQVDGALKALGLK